MWVVWAHVTQVERLTAVAMLF